MIKANYKTIELKETYKHINSNLHKKYKSKLWITNHFKLGNNHYNAMVLINNDNISLEFIFGNINNVDYDIILNEQQQDNIKRIALEFAKVNNYLKS